MTQLAHHVLLANHPSRSSSPLHCHLPRPLRQPPSLPAGWLPQNVTEAASEEAACNLEGNVTDCCESTQCKLLGAALAALAWAMCLLQPAFLCLLFGRAAAACLHRCCAELHHPAGCTYAAVERVNRDTVKPLVDELVKTPFFRYFKASRVCAGPGIGCRWVDAAEAAVPR